MARNRPTKKKSRSAPSQPPHPPKKLSEAESGKVRKSRNKNRNKSNINRAARRFGKWVIPILAAALATALATALTDLPDRLYDLLVKSDEGGSHIAPQSPVAAAVTTEAVPCKSGWVVSDRGQQQIPYSQGTAEKQPVNAVPSSGGNVVITIQGTTGQTVVLQSMTVMVVKRSPAAMAIYLPDDCQETLTPRYYTVNLDLPTPRVVPQPGSISFPYTVTSGDPEQFVITPEVLNDDVRWRLYLNWTSGAKSGRLTIEDSGRPFQTAGFSDARHFCNDLTGWKSSC